MSLAVAETSILRRLHLLFIWLCYNLQHTYYVGNVKDYHQDGVKNYFQGAQVDWLKQLPWNLWMEALFASSRLQHI